MGRKHRAHYHRSLRHRHPRSKTIEFLLFLFLAALTYYFIAPLIFNTTPSTSQLLRLRSAPTITSISYSIKQYENEPPCTKNCGHIAKALAFKCDRQKIPLDLACLQYYWIQSGCTSGGQNYPSSVVVRDVPWSKSKTIHDFMAYGDHSRNNKVQWMVRNATAVPNTWVKFNDRISNNIEETCEAENGKRIARVEWEDGLIVIDLDDHRADGWYTYYNRVGSTGPRIKWGEGSVSRKYYPLRCKGDNFGLCKKGDHTESSAAQVAAAFAVLSREQ